MSARETGQTGGRRQSRTARKYVGEESDCGVVLMNHPNNERWLASRLATQDSGSGWFATPFL